MRSALANYMGMIAIAVVVVLVLGAVAVRIDRALTPDVPPGITATRAISGNAPDLLVDVPWLMQYRNQIDEIYDLGDLRQYNQGHIPGARHIYWQDAMRQHAANYGEPDHISMQPDPADVVGKLQLNVPQNARIVVYDSNNSERAAWLLWVMKINGYANVYVLDGGLAAWIGAGGQLSTEPAPTAEAAVNITPTWIEDHVWNRERLQERLSDPTVRLVDTRSADDLNDTVNGTIRQGHIPGAVNIRTADVLRPDGTFKSPDELRVLFESHGIGPDGEVVVYSLFSIHSGPVWLAFHVAGHSDVAIYQEGYVAWGSHSDLPLDTAPFPTPLPTVTPAATPVTSPGATPETGDDEGPTDLTGDDNPVTSTPAD